MNFCSIKPEQAHVKTLAIALKVDKHHFSLVFLSNNLCQRRRLGFPKQCFFFGVWHHYFRMSLWNYSDMSSINHFASLSNKYTRSRWINDEETYNTNTLGFSSMSFYSAPWERVALTADTWGWLPQILLRHVSGTANTSEAFVRFRRVIHQTIWRENNRISL